LESVQLTDQKSRIGSYAKYPQAFKLPEYEYAGRGKVYDEGCGTHSTYFMDHPFQACECQKTIRHFKKCCKHLDCPECVMGASNHRAGSIQKRVLFALKKYGGYSYHATISPSPRQQLLVAGFGVERFEQEIVLPILHDKFPNGFIIFLHIDRLSHSNKLRYPSVHWHAIGLTHKKFPFTKFDKANMRKEKKYSMIVKFMIDRSRGKYQLNREGIKNVASYVLSHCSWKKGKKAIHYHGIMSYSKLGYKKEYISYTSEQPVLCKHCGGKIYDIDEYEIVKYHYSNLIKKKLKMLEKQIQINKLTNRNSESIKQEIDRLKDKFKIIDEIKIISYDKSNYLTARIPYVNKMGIAVIESKKKEVFKNIEIES
jgi:hypothetical protein